MRFYRWVLASALLVLSVSISAQAEIKRFVQVAPGIYRGSEPTDLADIQTLAALGIKTIINLRTGETPLTRDPVRAERRMLAQYKKQTGYAIRQIHIPIQGAVTIVAPPPRASIDRALKELTDPANQPVFVHCKFGKDRTGLVVGLYRTRFEHWSPEQAYAEMKAYDFTSKMFGLYWFFWRETGYFEPGAVPTWMFKIGRSGE